jgi:hypothetical protein
LVGLVALWSLLGLLVMTSASWWVAEREMQDAAYYLKRQGIWLIASWGLFWLAICTSLRRWLRTAAPALLVGALMVAATLVVGSTVNGASQTGTTLVTNAITGTLRVGDIITIAGVNAVNRVTKSSDGVLQQFTVTANVASGANSAGPN